ncbi:MAG TPA: helix-turn-helix domain-containing protein [Opitutaceae bacterium]|jgi:transcriptional regulator with XRE-family HTH domain
MQSIGERLEEARKKKGISIREAAEATKIRGEYLQKFEGNQFEIGLTDIYTRGFLRGYANYLRLPSDRILADFAAIRGGEARTRSPSREVYGRMDLGISSDDDSRDASASAPIAEGAPRPQTRFQRPGDGLPKAPAIDPAVAFKGGLLVLGAVVLLILYLIVRAIIPSSGAPAAAHESARAAPEIQAATPAGPAAIVTVVATQPVRIKLVRKSDGVELFQGQLQAGDRRDVPNVPIYLTASDQAAVELEYKGRLIPTGHSGYERIQFDFSNQ